MGDGHRGGQRLWTQPLLLLVAVAVAFPVVLARTPTGHLPAAVGAAVALAALGLAAAVVGPRVGAHARAWLGWTQVAVAAVGLLALLHVAIPDRPEHGLPLAAAVVATVAPVSRTALRVPVQVLMVGGVAALLLRADVLLPEAVLWVVLLAFVAWLCGAFSRVLLSARRAARQARRSSERRAELLAAVGDLSGRTSGEAATTVTTTLRSLGFSVAGVSVLQGELMAPLALDGIPPAGGLRVGQGVAGTAVAEDRTIVAGDYQRDPRRLEHRKGVRAVVAVPVRVQGEAVGVVLGGRHVPGRPPDSMIEVCEVLAGHLGGVLEAERRLQRQRELLERMQALESMRARLVSEISEHLRDPLTVVRGTAQTLVAHGEMLSGGQRRRLLEGFELQTRSLRETIDALLDFSMLTASHVAVTPALVRVRDVLDTVLADVVGDVGVTGDLDAVVRTDPELLRRSLELTLAVGGLERITVLDAGERVAVRLEGEPLGPPARAWLLLRLAERMMVAVDGTWEVGARHVEIRLPRARTPGGALVGAEAAEP